MQFQFSPLTIAGIPHPTTGITRYKENDFSRGWVGSFLVNTSQPLLGLTVPKNWAVSPSL